MQQRTLVFVFLHKRPPTVLLGNWTFHPFVSLPLDVLPPIHFAPGNIQHFLLIQLKPKQHHLDVYDRRTGLATLSSVGAVL